MNKWALMVGIGSGLATTIFGLLVCIWRLSVWAPEMDVEITCKAWFSFLLSLAV